MVSTNNLMSGLNGAVTNLEEPRRNGGSRGIYRTEGPTRRNRNRATDLPPIQRVRAYDNRGADMTI